MTVATNGAIENVVIIGSGPAGYTAATYAARANLKPVVFEGYQLGGIPGGQLMTTTEVENFPGFPEGVTGPQLMDRMKAQAERWGAELYTEDVTWVDFSQRPFLVRSDDRELHTHSVIIATGATAKRLNLPHEADYWNSGISACAICDGAAPQFKGVELAVVGGGDTAAEEAIFLTKYGSHVHLLVRRDRMRASKTMQERVLAHPKITVHWNTQPIDVVGEAGKLTGIKILNTPTQAPAQEATQEAAQAAAQEATQEATQEAAQAPVQEASELAVKGLFYAIGHTPNTQIFGDQLQLDATGYIITQPGSVATSIDGVFAAGDVQDHEYRQAITAAGTGCMAALLAERWLSEHDLIVEYTTPEAQATLETTQAATQVTTQAATQAATQVTTQAATQAATRDTLTIGDPEADFDPQRVRHVGSYALRKLYHESDRLLIVKYVSPTCGPCHILKPILDKVVDEFSEQVHFIEIDIAAESEIAEAAGVVGTPTLQFFKAKAKVAEVRGVKQKSEYRQLISSNL